MKKIVYLLIAGTVLSLSACKSSKNAYKEAYEKAVEGDAPKTVIEEPVVADNQAPTAEDVSNISVREEKVSVVSGEQEIKAYGIVCGSFSLKANADALRERLVNDGYKAVVVVNEAGKTYRVVCASFDTKEEAVAERTKFKTRYPDNQDFQSAWILYRK
ncbi:MAG: SPOR domain-containing protein [Bacteroidaceae bacterium]|nr:SPOR domain-containing protein [Bacteroidaceae bacterium]